MENLSKKGKKKRKDENSTDVRVFVAKAAAPERAEEKESRELSAEAGSGREPRGARARQPQASPRLNAQTPPGDLLKTDSDPLVEGGEFAVSNKLPD